VNVEAADILSTGTHSVESSDSSPRSTRPHCVELAVNAAPVELRAEKTAGSDFEGLTDQFEPAEIAGRRAKEKAA
jgi:hypothetical protein